MKDYKTILVPYHNVENVLFYFMAQTVPYEGLAKDIFDIINTAYRNRRLTKDHILIMRFYGEKGEIPRRARHREARACTIWKEAIDILKPAFINHGIVREQGFGS